MDPVTQAILGAAPAVAAARRDEVRVAALTGALAGAAADLDTLIRSGDDTLLYLDFHRHFTHALVFIPIGAALVAAVIWLAGRRRLAVPPKRLYLFCLLGYATHGLLDACTSYGTRLWWPWTDASVAWRLISVVDPLFTLPLLACVVAATVRRRRVLAVAGLLWAVAYLGVGAVQHARADAASEALAASRGHQRERALVKPTIANLFLWRSVYAHDGRLYVDGVRVGTSPQVYEGRSLRALPPSPPPADLPPGSRQAEDVARFTRFSQGWVAIDPREPDYVIDVRYSMLPTDTAPLWGLRLLPTQPESHARFEEREELSPGFREAFTDMLFGRDASGAR